MFERLDVLLVASTAKHQQLTAKRWFGKNPNAALAHLTPAEARRRFKFDHGHPVDGMAYVLNPCVADHYIVPAVANERMAQEKLSAFTHIAACLGARKIELLAVEMKTDERQASVQLPSLLAKLGVSGSLTREGNASRQVYAEFHQADQDPFVPEQYEIWLDMDPVLRGMVQMRLTARPHIYSVDLHLSDVMEAAAKLEAEFGGKGVELGGKIRSIGASLWRFAIEFWPSERAQPPVPLRHPAPAPVAAKEELDLDDTDAWDESTLPGAPVYDDTTGAVVTKVADYRVESLIARDSLSRTYIGRRPSGALVALHRVDVPDPGQSELLFRRQISLLTGLDHPNIVRLLGHFYAERERYLVFGYCKAGSVESFVRSSGGRLPTLWALQIGVQAAAGLQHLHDKGIVHRGIKPANLWLAGHETLRLCKIAGFDLALRPARDREPDGSIAGTLAYMSPEQVTGAAPTPSLDVWALAVTIYELLAGRTPIDSNDFVGVMKALAAGQLTPIRDLEPDLPSFVADVLDRALAQKLADRITTAGELGAELEAALAATLHG